MYKFYIVFILFPFLGFSQDLDHFNGLKCRGDIPPDFTTLSSKISEQDYELNQDENLDEEFFLSTRFYIDELLHSGRILFNDDMSNYVSSIAQYLLKDDPALLGKLRFYVIKSNAVNAFSTDQGIILFTTGLLSKAENEAQIAFILAHEISHYTKLHVRKGYVEYKDYLKSKGKYRRLSYYDAINTLSKYDKTQELEADQAGVDLFAKTEYDPSEIEHAFLMLHYSYLPLRNVKFDKAFLESSYLKIPEAFILDSIKEISTDLNYNDSGHTHPNIGKRIVSANEHLNSIESSGKKKYIIRTEKEFNEIQRMAQFESINLDIRERFYTDALYNIFILSKEIPQSRFLDLSKVKCLYGLSKYKNHNRFDEVTSRLFNIEGESYRLHYLFKLLTREQLNILTLRHLCDMTRKYPDDSVFKAYFEDFKKEFAIRSLVNFDKLKNVSIEADLENQKDTLSFNVDDSIRKIEISDLPKMEKINRKKELLAIKNQTKSTDPEKNFHLYALVDLVATAGFINELTSIKNQFELEQSQQKTNEQLFDNGYQLGIDRLVVVDPIYEDYTLKSEVDLLKSEKRKIQISETYTKEFKRLDLSLNIVDPKSLTTADVEKYNDIALIKDWMSEVLDHDGIDMISSTRYEMAEVRSKYNSDNFLFSGIYGYKARKEFTAGHYIMLGTVYLSPIVLVDMLAVHNYFEMVSIEINAETDEIEMLDIQDVNLKAYSKIIRSYIYNVLYQIQADK